MKCFESPSHDPAYNLALEEYLFATRRTGDILLVWWNSPCVIIGKNQHISREVDLVLAAEEGIPVIRRSTGGGAVYQDMGNVNFSLMTDSSDRDYADFIDKITSALQRLGIPAEFNGRNDICVRGLKVSGSAAREENGRTLCHCTMLIDTDLEKMSALLTPEEGKLARNGVASVSARVGNISELVPGTDAGAVIAAVAGSAHELPLTTAEESGIMAIMTEKYQNERWNNSLL